MDANFTCCQQAIICPSPINEAQELPDGAACLVSDMHVGRTKNGLYLLESALQSFHKRMIIFNRSESDIFFQQLRSQHSCACRPLRLPTSAAVVSTATETTRPQGIQEWGSDAMHTGLGQIWR